MRSSKISLASPLSLEYFPSNNLDDPSSPFMLIDSLSQEQQLYSPELLSNSRYSSFPYSSETCRFGHGLTDDPRPPFLPMHQFRQLACSSCLLYVATVKQKCNLEYLATPDGLVSISISPDRVCSRHNHNTVHTTWLGTATEIPGNQVEPTPHSQGKLSQLLTIPDDLTSRNFFCDVLLQGEESHCKLWRECCKAAINCCKHKLRISRPTESPSVCPATWDGILCWSAASTGSIMKQECPPYFVHESSNPFHTRPIVFKNCTAEGWFKIEGREYSETKSCIDEVFME